MPNRPGVEFFHQERNEPCISLTAIIGFGALIDCQALVTIGEYVFVGHRVMILTGTHDYTLFGLARQRAQIARPVVIKDGAWIASGAIICPGVTIGEHAVVTAGSVVTSNVPAYTLVGGNPARKLRKLK